MPTPRVSKLDLKVMDILWTRGASSAREIQESFPERGRPAYRTVQTTVYRLETEKAVRRVRKIRNAQLFAAVVSRAVAQRRLVDDLVGLFGRRTQHVMAHLIESGKLTHDEMREAKRVVRTLGRKTGVTTSRPPRTVPSVSGGVPRLDGRVNLRSRPERGPGTASG